MRTHNGDAAPRRALWSRNEPVSVLGAWRNAHGQQELDQLFTSLGESFSDCMSFEFELLACDVIGDMAYTAGLEHTSASVDGEPRTLGPGEIAVVPPRTTHAFRNASGASVRFLNFHTPGMRFDEYVRKMDAGEKPDPPEYDSFTEES